MDDERIKRDVEPNSLESLGQALTSTIRRGFEAIDSSDRDEVLEVLLRFYSFATMRLAEEAHAWGVVDPLDELEAQAGMLREGYPELSSRSERGPDAVGKVSDQTRSEMTMSTKSQHGTTEAENAANRFRPDPLWWVGHAFALSIQPTTSAINSYSPDDALAMLEGIGSFFELATEQIRTTQLMTEVLAELHSAALALCDQHPALPGELQRFAQSGTPGVSENQEIPF